MKREASTVLLCCGGVAQQSCVESCFWGNNVDETLWNGFQRLYPAKYSHVTPKTTWMSMRQMSSVTGCCERALHLFSGVQKIYKAFLLKVLYICLYLCWILQFLIGYLCILFGTWQNKASPVITDFTFNWCQFLCLRPRLNPSPASAALTPPQNIL